MMQRDFNKQLIISLQNSTERLHTERAIICFFDPVTQLGSEWTEDREISSLYQNNTIHDQHDQGDC